MAEAIFELVAGIALLALGGWRATRRYASIPKPGDAGRYPPAVKQARWMRNPNDQGAGTKLILFALGVGLLLVLSALHAFAHL